MQCGDVAESDERTRILSDGVIVDAIENTHRAITATREDESVVFVRPQELVEDFKSLVIAAREIRMRTAMIDVRRQRDAQPARLEIALRDFNARKIGGR